MANPFAAKAKSSSAAKFKSMTGKKSSGQGHPDEAQDKVLIKKMIKQDKGEYKIGGAVSAPRADKFARGGKAKGKKGTTINIAVIGGGKEGAEGAPPMPPMPKPPMALPPPGAGPGGPPGGAMPPGMPPMKRGGKVGMTAGAETGVGRLQKARKRG